MCAVNMILEAYRDYPIVVCKYYPIVVCKAAQRLLHGSQQLATAKVSTFVVIE